MADPKVGDVPQAGTEGDPQAGGAGAGAVKSATDETISIEKARELRSENKSLRDRMKALEDEKATRDADAKKAAEAKARDEGRLGDVLKEREAEIADLLPRANLAAKLETLFVEQFAAESKDWPEEIKALMPESLEARIDTWPKLRAAAVKSLGVTTPPLAGNGRGPKPAGAQDPAAAADGAKSYVASKRVYSL